MHKLKNIDELRQAVRDFEQAVIDNIAVELGRINRRVYAHELDFTSFNKDIDDYFDAICLDENGVPTLVDCIIGNEEKRTQGHILFYLIDYWDTLTLLNQLQRIPQMLKTYTIKGRKGQKDISFTIQDLIPIPSAYYNFEQLVQLINYSEYEPDYKNKMREEYALLYENPEHKEINFFRINGTEIIVIPSKFCLHTTILKEQDIRCD